MAEPAANPAASTVDPVAGLIDIPLPPAVSLLPQTWPARIAVAAALVVTVVALVWLVRHWWVNRYRRRALAELDSIAHAPADDGSAARVALLVRRTALAVFPREQVAALSGDAWLAFLDRSYGGSGFSAGPGRDLEIAAYRPAGPDARLPARIDLVRQWIKVHHA